MVVINGENIFIFKIMNYKFNNCYRQKDPLRPPTLD